MRHNYEIIYQSNKITSKLKINREISLKWIENTWYDDNIYKK